MNSTTDPRTKIVYDTVYSRYVSAAYDTRLILVSNGSTDKGVHFDNFLITKMKGKTRQTQWASGDDRSAYNHASRRRGPASRGVINHSGSSSAFAPAIADGLRIAGLDGHTDDYRNMYTAKELQSGEFHLPYSTGLEMYDFHARFYDPQLGRWFAPDPAEQFSNPYLAMGNNPVMYVDPDGEWVFIAAMAIAGGYLGGSVANNTFNPGDWDWNSASTYVGIGIGAAVGGFGGAGISAGVKAGTISKTKLVSNLYTGGLNALYNYHPEQDVLTTLSYFASGYGAAAVGSFASGGGAPLWEAKLASSMVGGMGNLAVAGMSGEIGDGITTPGQAFVGGAVVGYSGMSLHAKKAGLKSKYLFGKGSDKLLTRGLSNMATNYAFTDPEDWSKMTGHQRWGAPFMYGAVGTAAESLMPFEGIKGTIENRILFTGISAIGYSVAFGAEYVGMTFSKGYYNEFKDAKYGKWKKKAGIVGWKSLFYGLPVAGY